MSCNICELTRLNSSEKVLFHEASALDSWRCLCVWNELGVIGSLTRTWRRREFVLVPRILFEAALEKLIAGSGHTHDVAHQLFPEVMGTLHTWLVHLRSLPVQLH